MAGLPAKQIAQAELAIANAARVHDWRLLPSKAGLVIPVRTSKSDTEQLLRTSKLENLFILHRDRRLRGGTSELSGALSTPFLFAAVALLHGSVGSAADLADVGDLPSLIPDAYLAVQAEPGPPSPHSQTEAR